MVTMMKPYIEINFDNGINYIIKEGDVLTGLQYTENNTIKTIDGKVRVINGVLTSIPSNRPTTCPPEPYLQNYMKSTDLILDTSEENSAELKKIPVSSIIAIKEVNDISVNIASTVGTYDTITDAISSSSGEQISIAGNITEDVTINTGTVANIVGAGIENTVITGTITINNSPESDENGSITLKNFTFDGKGSIGMAIVSAEQTTTEIKPMTIILENVYIKGYIGKAIYITNGAEIVLKNCTIEDCATMASDTRKHSGDYAVDINLVGVNNKNINITSCVFNNPRATYGELRIAKRGGLSDAGSSEIPVGISEAEIVNVTIENNNFKSSAYNRGIITIGTKSFTSGGEANTTGVFNASLVHNVSKLIVKYPYISESTIDTFNACTNATKTGYGQFIINH